jgi:hypothetical protein
MFKIADMDWHFTDMPSAPDAVYGAVRNQAWTLVDSSYIFFDVICEAPVLLRGLHMNLTVDE